MMRAWQPAREARPKAIPAVNTKCQLFFIAVLLTANIVLRGLIAKGCGRGFFFLIVRTGTKVE